MNQPLSPAAQAVKDAVLALYSDEKTHKFGWQLDAPTAAAVLRALADQVVPDGPRPNANSDYHLMNWTKTLDQYAQRQQTRAEILTIAAELEDGR